MVSAWAAANGIPLGQVKVIHKSNEITAIPELLNALDLQNCIVTIDAMGCQTAISKKIIERKADYVLHVKNNQKNLYETLQLWFNDMDKKNIDVNKQYYARRYAKYRTEETDDVRREVRECFVNSNGAFMNLYWHRIFNASFLCVCCNEE